MQKFLTAIAVFLFYFSGVFATDFPTPKQAILGGDVPVRKGEMVVLSVSPLAETPNLKSVTYFWKILDSNFKEKQNVITWHDGTKVFFGAGLENKKLLVCLTIVYHFEVRTDGKIVESGTRCSGVLITEIQIGDDPSPTPPGPSPVPPGPNPVPPTPVPPTPVIVPDGQYKIAPFVYNEVMKSTLSPEMKVRAARAYSSAFSGVSAAAAAGTIKDIREMLTKTKEAVESALAREGIDKKLFDGIDSRVGDFIYNELYKTGKIKTVQDFKACWDELVLGLGYVR